MPQVSRFALAVAVALTTACGARTDVGSELDGSVARPDADSPPDGGRDGGPPPFDGGPRPIDAGPPPTCGELVPLTARIVVHEDSSGVLGAPQVVFREGGFDLVATFSAVDDDRINDVRVRRLTVGPGGDASLGDVVTLGWSPLSPASAATRGGDLGVLSSTSTGALEPEVRLWTYTGDDYEPRAETSVWSGRAVDVSGRGGEWLAAIHGDAVGGRQTFFVTLDPEGTLLSMPRSAVDPSLPGYEDARVRTTATRGPFAWVSSPLDATGTFSVAFLREPGLQRITLGGARPVVDDDSPLAIAPSPWDSTAVLVAGYDYGALFLESVSTTGGWRSTTLSFSMVGDVPPALATGDFGAVLAGMHFGDADPTGGLLEVLLLGDGAALRGPSFAFEARRSSSFGEAGIDAATGGEHIVLHFTHFEPATGTWQTQAIVLACE